ncbi:MAG: manganese efflux pump MntP family protein [Candidatus Korobacteraceae bacterium]|jgi:putative Mn2+ efflux pump MntP
MSWFGLLAIAVALALDAFAVAVVAGLSLRVLTKRHLFRLSFHFGLFQAGMLAAGWLIGNALYTLVASAAHWVAFTLLLLVGGNVIWHAFSGDGEARTELDPTSGWHLVFLSFATSLDALAVGLSLAMIGVPIARSASVVGFMATALTLLGMALGRRVSILWGKRVEVFGGLMLIAIGFKFLWDHIRA